MTRPSPLRKLVPPLVIPAGLLLMVGYCYVDRRSNAADRRAEIEQRSVRVVDESGTERYSVAAELKPISLRALSVPVIVLVAAGFGVAALIRGRGQRDPKDAPATDSTA